jgi:hypothetical protein
VPRRPPPKLSPEEIAARRAKIPPNIRALVEVIEQNARPYYGPRGSESVCVGCARLRGHDVARDFRGSAFPGRDACVSCGRPVRYHFWVRRPAYRKPTICSRRCSLNRATARAKQVRKDRREETTGWCRECCEEFTPTRSDARYCSTACRMRAYRQRAAN